MGLAASQVRLLSLTSRQHSIEGEAQRIMANKMRLANDSDTAYTKYMNALDETHLQSLQTNEDGSCSWIDGSINNLLRFAADKNSSGNIFYVQDLQSGKLYMPKDIYDAYMQNLGESGDMRSFVEKFEGIKYSEEDTNAYIVENYNKLLSYGYDKILADTESESNEIVRNYYNAVTYDQSVIDPANLVLNYLPKKNSEGIYFTYSSVNNLAGNYNKALESLMSQENYTTLYSKDERNLIEASRIFSDLIDDYGFEDEHDEVSEYFKYDVYYTKKNLSANINGKTYVDGIESLSGEDRMAMTLNGGKQTWSANRNIIVNYSQTAYAPEIDSNFINNHPTYAEVCDPSVYNEFFHYKMHSNIDKNDNIVHERNIYDITFSFNGTDTTINQLLNKLGGGYSNVGDAVEAIVSKVANQEKTADIYLDSLGITASDISKYQEFLSALNALKSYKPNYVWVANDEKRAEYYEGIFKAIDAAGGCIEADSKQSNSPSWVSNMIKNSQVILTMWDEEEQILSKTSSALNVNIKEVSDNNYIERVSQEYEEALTEINAKDSKFDKRLSILETERNAIVNEMESLKSISNNNVETYFKVFT